MHDKLQVYHPRHATWLANQDRMQYREKGTYDALDLVHESPVGQHPMGLQHARSGCQTGKL